LAGDRGDSRPSVSPVERHFGIIDLWTLKSARQALWVVARMTPQRPTFDQIGSMAPSKSCLDRPPEQLSEVWKAAASSTAAQDQTEVHVLARAIPVTPPEPRNGRRPARRQELHHPGSCRPAAKNPADITAAVQARKWPDREIGIYRELPHRT